jgi:hypothetical protein
MIKYRSSTRWPGDWEVGLRRVLSAPCTWRRGSQVSWLSLKIKVYGLSVVWCQNHWDGFPGLGLKTMRGSICWLHHKTDGRINTARGMR